LDDESLYLICLHCYKIVCCFLLTRPVPNEHERVLVSGSVACPAIWRETTRAYLGKLYLKKGLLSTPHQPDTVGIGFKLNLIKNINTETK